MRMLMNITFPTEPFNSAARDGTVGPRIKRILDAQAPQAVYFTERDGERGAVLVVDVKEASDVPSLAEPWFLTFDALVEFRIAMTPDDLAHAGLDVLGKVWG
ncbi:hypothetical protein [uncultured Rhodoblastus sp.]|uniref:hypothetical protein n=1 Tax=uncultured Rhodoblastus sp. TaxID=543037 RepID=UPI0025FEE228|nr:hypothetical protein [uncultured Rhodoblastus sp.]